MKAPNTSIKCAVCKGTGTNPVPHPHQCGACFGFGLSTASYDQRRNGTTITQYFSEPKRELPAGTEIHHQSPVFAGKVLVGERLLISWPNLDYRGN